jgi:LPS-assembly lipoprotein
LTGTGAVSEYQLDYDVTYRFKSKEAHGTFPVTIEATRTYTYDDSDILAKDEEEKRLVSGMEDQLIKTMATQISLSK